MMSGPHQPSAGLRRRATGGRGLALALALVAALGPAPAAAQQPNADALYQEGRRFFDALDYERAVVALGQAITALEALPPAEPIRAERLASAYEMRARSKFGLGDQDGARADFVLLLALAPAHALSGQVSPRVVALFEETARATVTNLTISLTPATARLVLNGAPLQGPGTIRVAVGEHVLEAEQAGYRSVRQTVTALVETPAEVSLVLERVSSVLRISTQPEDVEVKVDGVVIGRTAAGAESPGGGMAASTPLIVNDVTVGVHTVELRRACYVSASQKVEVDRPDDYTVGPVTLRPAVATLAVSANQPGAQVVVDGTDRGVAPLKVPDLCEGEHLVELRTKFGSDSRRITVRAGNDATVDGVLKPAFALVSASGAAPMPQPDVRVIVERAFGAARTVTLLAPPQERVDDALKGNQLSADWLAMDASGRAVGASAQIAGPLRQQASEKLADAFRAQGVGSVTLVAPSRVVLALLSAGSTAPDVIEIALDSPPSIAAAIARLDREVELSRASIGLQVIDVADTAGVVIVGVDATGPAAGTTARVGDVIVQADGKPVTDVASLSALVESRRPGETVPLDLKDGAGAAKRIEVSVRLAPRLIGLAEYGLLANRILLNLRARLADASDPFEQSVLRLNIAVALARIGDWTAAREELGLVKLPEQSGIGNGTVQYLLGVAAEGLGSRADAEAAFKAATASESLLFDDGPPVKELAEARLAELRKR